MTKLAATLRAKVTEVGNRLSQEAPAVTMTDDRLASVVTSCASGEVMAAAVAACLPPIAAGETQGAYGRRVLAEVAR